MNKYVLLLTALAFLAGSATAQTTDLLISEYIEGSSDNKAVEIFNGSGDIINLGEYSLLLYANGGSTPISTIPLDAIQLSTGSNHVLVNSNAEAGLLSYANQLSGSLTFNGDDALVLVSGSEVIDSIGTVGFDPGSGWFCAAGNTANQTMRRKAEICVGDDYTSNDFDPCLEWNFFVVDTFDGLGQHSTDCASVATRDGCWGALKAIYR